MGKFITRRAFMEKYATEEMCLDAIFKLQFGSLEHCPKCGMSAKFYRVRSRKCYQCDCGYQLYPMVGTIFENSKTKLTIWFEVLYDFLTAAKGLPATHVQKHYGMTYKCAWRMCMRIREAMAEPNVSLKDVVEMDESFYGGKSKLDPGTEKKGIGNKAILFGALQRRGGRVKITHVKKKDAKTLRPLIDRTVVKGSVIHHDNNSTYGKLRSRGYTPKLVPKKAKGIFQRVNNNTIESTWARVKRTFGGTYIRPSEKHLQKYLDEFCLRARGSGKWLHANLERVVFWIISYWDDSACLQMACDDDLA
jgi:transposase